MPFDSKHFQHYNQTPPLTEWIKEIDDKNFAAFNAEENTKFERLEQLNKTINLPYGKPESIELKEVYKNTKKTQEIIQRRGEEYCAIRLTPHNKNKSRLHARGLKLNEYIKNWIPAQKIDPNQFRLDILPQNTDIIYSAIFLINDYGIIGEITKGVHWQITQNMCDNSSVIFYFDFEKWLFSVIKETNKIDPGQEMLYAALEMLTVKDEDKRKKLTKTLKAEFAANKYLKGYFEFFVTPKKEILFNDYNRLIYNKLSDFRLYINHNRSVVKGITVSPGETCGTAKIIKNPKKDTISNGDIIVCHRITNEHLHLVKKAGAIIVEQGDLLSHLTIIARELKKPYIINAINATKKIPNNSKLLVNGDTGSVYFY